MENKYDLTYTLIKIVVESDNGFNRENANRLMKLIDKNFNLNVLGIECEILENEILENQAEIDKFVDRQRKIEKCFMDNLPCINPEIDCKQCNKTKTFIKPRIIT